MAGQLKISNFKKHFFNPKIDKKKLVRSIKYSFDDFDDLQAFVSQYRNEFKSASTLLNFFLHGKYPLPKDYKDLNTRELKLYNGHLIQELNWTALCLQDFSPELNDFIILQREFEDHLFKGEYKNARETIKKIDNEIGVSLWSIENRFILDEYELGTEENWNNRKIFLRDGIDPFIQSFSNIYSIRAEKNVSFFQFNNEIDRWLHAQGILDTTELQDIQEYLRFRGHFFSISKYTQYEYFLNIDGGASVIDKYIMFKRICGLLIIENKYLEPVLKLVSKLHNSIHDSTFRNLLLFDKSFSLKKLSNQDIDFNKIVDSYTLGDYEEVISKTKQYIHNYTTGEIQTLELYAKSLCETNAEYEIIIDEECLFDKIGFLIYDVLKKSKTTEDSLIQLLNYSYLLSNSRHGVFLYSFVSAQLGWINQIDYEFLHSFSSIALNPLFLRPCKDIIETSNNILLINSTSLQLLLSEYDLSTISEEELNRIPEIKKKLYSARHFTKNGLIENAKKIYLSLLNDSSISIIAQFEVYSELYKCYLLDQNYREAIKLFVSVNSKNQHLTKQMSDKDILEGVIKGKFKNLGSKSDLIELPIFFRINSNDRIRIKQSMELFLRSINCVKPSDFLEEVSKFSKTDVLYFLKNVCSIEILQLLKSFESTFDVNEERIIICKFLTEFDNTNSDRYKEEIADLTQKNTISKVIGGIDERKIFVNEPKLKKNIKKIQKQSVFQNETISPLSEVTFERYIKLNEYIKNNNEYTNLNPVKFSEEGELLVGHQNPILDEFDIIFYYPAFQIFSTFFLHIRDLFVFNKENGLDTYLSTKIRHGTLPNHLRSVFESSNLVTVQSNNSYVENQHWNDRLSLKDDEQIQLQTLLSNFSMNVDQYSKTIKDDLIQCKNEFKNQDSLALFDFSYTEENLMDLYLQKFHEIHDLNDFIDISFIELWNKTESILDVIRNKFNGEFKDKFLSFLADLEKKLNEFKRDQVNELLSSIMTCRTDIQHKLNNVSEWFRRSESSYEGEYEVNLLAHTSIEITKNIHPTYLFEIETELKSIKTIKGEYHEHFIDLLNNCLFNMIEHSELNSEELEAKLTIFEDKDNLFLKFKNRVKEPEKHVAKLTDVKHNWDKNDSNIAQERGTGFPKVKKIIASDLNRKYSFFEFKNFENEIEIELSFELNEL